MLPTPSNLDKINMSLDAIRQLCLQRFDFFCTAVLGYQVTPFHADMINHILSTPHSLVLAPRGSGKSTIGDVAYCIWMILRNPNIRICIASKSGPQAKGFLGEIKQHFESNTDLIKIFGDWCGPIWNEDEVVVCRRDKIKKEPTITAVGSGAGIPGRHFDLIIADDLVDLENSSTDHQREKTKSWFYAVLLPTLEPEGELRVIGTRYNVADLYGHFAAKDKTTGAHRDKKVGPHVHCIAAIQTNDEGQEVSFWPDKFPLSFLLDMRYSMGLAIFSLQMQNDASITDGQIMKIEDLEGYTWSPDFPHPPLEELAIFMGVDPAISEKQEADFFAIAVIGIHNSRDIYVLDMFKGKLSFNKQLEQILKMVRQWNPERVGIEAVAYQRALAQAVKEFAFMPAVQEVMTRTDKTQRARVFSAFVERHEVHFRYDMIDAMNCLVGMPNVDHDDEFDAVDIATEAAKHTVLARTMVAVMPTNLRKRA